MGIEDIDNIKKLVMNRDNPPKKREYYEINALTGKPNMIAFHTSNLLEHKMDR